MRFARPGRQRNGMERQKAQRLGRWLRLKARILEEGAAGAGPPPVLGLGDQASAHGIPFDVMTDALEFGRVPDPVIKRFVLPKRLSRAAQRGVGVARRDTLDDAGDFGKREAGVQEDMDMVGHDDIGVQDEAAEIGAAPDGVFGVVCELGVG
jgi:hypothetical protein